MECPRRLRNASPLHGRQREGYLGLADARIGARFDRDAVLASVLLSDAGRERAEGAEGPRLSKMDEARQTVATATPPCRTTIAAGTGQAAGPDLVRLRSAARTQSSSVGSRCTSADAPASK